MLYVLELQVELHYNEPTIIENETPDGVKFETTGSVKYINSMPKQTKIVDADNEALAREKIENHYAALTTNDSEYKITILSITETIV